MTDCTPAQARELATRLQDPQDHYEADSPAALNAILLSLCQDAANDLRSLADQVERLTAERDALHAELDELKLLVRGDYAAAAAAIKKRLATKEPK